MNAMLELLQQMNLMPPNDLSPDQCRKLIEEGMYTQWIVWGNSTESWPTNAALASIYPDIFGKKTR